MSYMQNPSIRRKEGKEVVAYLKGGFRDMKSFRGGCRWFLVAKIVVVG
jgi:hypothetical protein